MMSALSPAKPSHRLGQVTSWLLAALIGAAASDALAAQGPASSVTGRVAGHDGKPLAKAHVHLTRPAAKKPLKTVEISPDGRFRVEITERGPLLLQFTGAHHAAFEVPLLIDEPQHHRIDIRLNTYHYADPLGEVKIIGDFNRFDYTAGKPLQKQPDGTWTFDVKATSNRVAYQLLGIEATGRSVNGTQSDSFEYDGGGDYRSILRATKGKALRIVFDPKRLVRSDAPPEVRFQDANSRAARLASIYAENHLRQQSYYRALTKHIGAGKQRESLRMDWEQEAASISRRLEGETDPLVRSGLWFSLLGLADSGGSIDPEMIRRALSEVSPASLLWSYFPSYIALAVRYTGGSASVSGVEGQQASERVDYVDKVVDGLPDATARPLFLYWAVFTARESGQQARAKRLTERLLAEHGDSTWAKVVRQFAADAKIRVGARVPDFSLPSLEDPARRHTRENLAGKILLIDFWATWCMPCLAEMENLHKAYEGYKGRGLEILSLSFDDEKETVARFRKDKWKMPWLHSFVEGGFESETAKSFEVQGIPKPILVNERGEIIAAFEELSGPNLAKTLDRVFGERK